MPQVPVAGWPGLAPSQLLQACDLAQFEFQTTAELQGLDALIGQARATEAVRFGVGIRQGASTCLCWARPAWASAAWCASC